MNAWRAGMSVLLLAFAACTEKSAPPPAPGPEDATTAAPTGQWYRMTIKDSSAEIPFFLYLPPSGADGAEKAVIANGEERIAVDQQRNGDRVALDFPVFHARVEVHGDGGGGLLGEWTSGPIAGSRTLTLRGRRVDQPDPLLRFPAKSGSATADLSGEWKLESKHFGTSKAVFKQDAAGRLTGTILLAKVADLRFLAGVVTGKELLLSTFEGQHAYLVEAELDENGRLEGTITWAGVRESDFTAVRADGFELDFLHVTKLKPGKKKLSLPALRKYAGKPVLLDVFGTWCSACLDTTPFLRELKAKYGPRGLEILGLALEATDDRAYAEGQVEKFRTKYGVDWEIVTVIGDGSEAAKQQLPELTDVEGMPTSIFVRRDGTVHAIHTGFAGPAAKEDHQRMRAQFEALIEEIVKP